MKKGGQVTIFVVLALIFVGGILAFVFLKGESEVVDNEIYENDNIEMISEFVRGCALQEISNGMDTVYYKNTDEFEDFLNYNVEMCIDNFSVFEDLDIVSGDLDFEVVLNEEENYLDIYLDYPLEVSSNNGVDKIDGFDFRQALTSMVVLEISNGKTAHETLLVSPDNKFHLKIEEGTVALGENGEIIDEIVLEMVSKEDFKTPYDHIAGNIVYKMSPEGATFNPPLKLTYEYGEDGLQHYINEDEIRVAYYIANPTDGVYWLDYEDNSIDSNSNTLEASISHFTDIAVLDDVEEDDPIDNPVVNNVTNETNSTENSTEEGNSPNTCGAGQPNSFGDDKWCSTDCNTGGSCPEGTINCDCYGHCGTYGDSGACEDLLSGGSYTCKKVIDNKGTDGFFSLLSYDDKLYAGAFGYGQEGSSMLFGLKNNRITPGITGISESVCVMREFNGYIYANTEASGKIYRSQNGKNWEMVYSAPAGKGVGCALAVKDGYIYAGAADFINHKSIVIRSSNGKNWNKVNNNNLYLRELVTYNDTIYGFGVNGASKPKMIFSTDGENWETQDTDVRFLRGNVLNGTLWLGAATVLGGSGESGVWKFDGEEFSKVYNYGKPGTYVSYVESWKGNLFAGVSQGWKDANGPTALLYSSNGGENWKTACTIPDAAIWDVEVHDDRLFVAGWDYVNGGSVYEVLVGGSSSGQDGDNTFVWKPVSETRLGNAAVVIPASFPDDCNVFVNGERHAEFAGRSEELGNRLIYFMGKTGSAYGASCNVEAKCGSISKSWAVQCGVKYYGFNQGVK